METLLVVRCLRNHHPSSSVEQQKVAAPERSSIKEAKTERRVRLWFSDGRKQVWLFSSPLTDYESWLLISTICPSVGCR